MRTNQGAALVAFGMVFIACSSGGLVASDGGSPGADADAGDASAPPPAACAKGTRLFNGECRTICTGGKKCPGADYCIEVDTEALCLPYADCAYLGDDTQCVATGGMYSYAPRSGYATFLPYLSTPGANPNDAVGLTDPYFYGGYGGGQSGPCAGDATWVVKPVQAPVGCTANHTVTRCRLFYDRCELVSGTTHEFLQP